MQSKVFAAFRVIGYLEGLSFLVLLFAAMPLKYFADIPGPVAVTGAIHGALFVLYLLALAAAAVVFRWTLGRVIGGVVASLLPFGPFVFERRIANDR